MPPNATPNPNELRIFVTPLREPKSGCGDRKRTYDTINEARQAVAYSWSRTGCNLGVYKCRQCGKYHITHQLTGRGDYVKFVSHPNFSGKKPNGLDTGWCKEGEKPRTKEEIAAERKDYLDDVRAKKAKLNRVKRRIKWRDRDGGEEF